MPASVVRARYPDGTVQSMRLCGGRCLVRIATAPFAKEYWAFDAEVQFLAVRARVHMLREAVERRDAPNA